MTSDETTTEQSPASDASATAPDEDGPPTDGDARGDGATDGDATAAGATADSGDGDDDGAEQSLPRAGDESKSRDVVVPMRVYKAVTVFTTLFAVATVVGGFILLDTATDRGQASLGEIDAVLALVGIGLLVSGAAAYAFSTRFRTAGMGKSKDDTDEGSDNG